MNIQYKLLTMDEIKDAVAPLARTYGADSVYLFGSYARGEATDRSDVDILVFGGPKFHLTHIFAFAEELRNILQKDIDMYEIHEINEGSDFHGEIMKERLRIA